MNKEDVARYGLPTDLPEGVKKGIEVAKAEARARAEQARARAKEKALAKEAEAIAQAKENGAELPAVFLTQMELAAKASVHSPLSLGLETSFYALDFSILVSATLKSPKLSSMNVSALFPFCFVVFLLSTI